MKSRFVDLLMDDTMQSPGDPPSGDPPRGPGTDMSSASASWVQPACGKSTDLAMRWENIGQNIWFVVEPPLWKIWLRQLGWLETHYMEHKPFGSFTVPRFWWNRYVVTIPWPFLEEKQPLIFFEKISVVNPYRVLCPKTSRIRTPLFIAQSVARVCPVWARMSLSWHSQRHCWLLMYIHKSLLGLPPTVLVMEFGIPSFSKVQ